MDILVINGSPKGTNSITLRTAQYLEALHPEHQFDYLHAGAQIAALEQDFSKAKRKMQEADLILFAYPVYTFLAPAQLHRFIELAVSSGTDLLGKHASQITTSKHFYDVTAHAWLEENMKDLGLTTHRGLSADMEDLTTARGRQEAESFFDYLMFEMEAGMGSPPKEDAKSGECPPFRSSSESGRKSSDFRVALVHCGMDTSSNLREMVQEFASVFPYEVRTIDLDKVSFRGGCLGCLRCAADGNCVYTDGFQDLLRNEIETCDAVLYAFPVTSHFAPSVLKTYNDRQFCNGHRTTTEGQPTGYLLAGRYTDEKNLQTVLEARAEVGGNFLAGVATDEKNAEESIRHLSEALAYALRTGMQRPRSFYGRGGQLIFRDLVWKMQGMMKADHEYFREHGVYDFPQKDKKTILGMKLVGAMLRSKRLGPAVQQQMSTQMTKPYDKIVEAARTKTSADAG